MCVGLWDSRMIDRTNWRWHVKFPHGILWLTRFSLVFCDLFLPEDKFSSWVSPIAAVHSLQSATKFANRGRTSLHANRFTSRLVS